MKNVVHIVMQGKGGVGKSLAASLLTQWFSQHGPLSIDTDPVNQTLYSYKGLNVQHLNILDGTSVNERNFDRLMEAFIGNDVPIIVDVGTSTFLPLANYMLENAVNDILTQQGKTIVFHVIVTGGQAMEETLKGLASLHSKFGSDVKYIVWLNRYFGDIVQNGSEFEDMEVFKSMKDQIVGVIELERKTSDTFGADVKKMLENHLTFEEVMQSSDFAFMEKVRLTSTRDRVFSQIDFVLGEENA